MKHLRTAALVALTATACPAFAAEVDSYVDLYIAPYSTLTVGTADSDEGYGFGIKGAAALTESFFLQGEYQSNNYEFTGGDADLATLRFGGGYAMALPLWVVESVNGRVEYIRSNLGAGGYIIEEGLGVHAGASGNITESIGVHASLGYLDVGAYGDGFELLVGSSGNLTQTLGWFADYRMAQLEDTVEFEPADFRVGVRMVLGAQGSLFGAAGPAKAPAKR